MKLVIKQEVAIKEEPALELWLERSEHGHVRLCSQQGDKSRVLDKVEFVINEDGSWYKVSCGNLSDDHGELI